MTIGTAKTGTSALALASAGLALTIGLSACKPGAAGNNSMAGGAGAVTNPCTMGSATLSSAIPNNAANTEVGMDCFAWQSFIALNWKADPNKPGYPDPAATATDFGLPTDQTPKVWETYLEAGTVFGTGLKGQWQVKRPAGKNLVRTSKFGDLDLSSIIQAGSGNHWLTSQRGDVTYYEIMMNRDEYEFITTQKFDLTTAAGQLACATQPGKVIPVQAPAPGSAAATGTPSPLPSPSPTGPLRGGLTLPEGAAAGWDDTDCEGNVKSYGDGVGAMEIKASWTPLPADHSLDYRYKTAIAQVTDPTTHTVKTVTVGLVGLHIARKRFASHEWTWSTFEHIDNSPDEGPNNSVTDPVLPANPNIVPRTGYTFYGANCNPATNAYKCVHNAPPTPCLLGSTKCDPYNAPMQITRINPVGSVANSVTAWYWGQMPKNSVYNYYRLIDVQFPQQPGQPIGPKQTLPLPQGNPMPKGAAGGVDQILANTTLESFQQKAAACMDCHANFAQIATAPTLTQGANGLRQIRKLPQGTASPYASDYSFLFVTETRR